MEEMKWVQRTREEVEAFVHATWPDADVAYDWSCVEIETVGADFVEFTVKNMYEYVDLDFAKLKAVADFFGTLDVRTDKDSHGGCETCDYGSSYEVTFRIRPAIA